MLLRDDHAELDVLLKGTFAALEKADDSSAIEMLDLFWARLAMHIRAEHLHLFPAILENCGQTQSAPSDIRDKLELLRHDHDFFMRELARAIKSMRAINAENSARTVTEIGRRLREIEKRLIEHNRIEETEIYPLLHELTALRDPVDLISLMKRELDSLPPRFR
jgi:hemerythrin superfamily protein